MNGKDHDDVSVNPEVHGVRKSLKYRAPNLAANPREGDGPLDNPRDGCTEFLAEALTETRLPRGRPGARVQHLGRRRRAKQNVERHSSPELAL
jgi:hypothetical protein